MDNMHFYIVIIMLLENSGIKLSLPELKIVYFIFIILLTCLINIEFTSTSNNKNNSAQDSMFWFVN